jgi:hypothetical protein
MQKKISPTIQMYESAAASFGSRPLPVVPEGGLLPGLAPGGGFCIAVILLY